MKVFIFIFYFCFFGIICWVCWMCYIFLVFLVIIYGIIDIWYIVGCVFRGLKLLVCDEIGLLILVGGVFIVVVDVLLFGLLFLIIGGLRLSRDMKSGLVVLFGFVILWVFLMFCFVGRCVMSLVSCWFYVCLGSIIIISMVSLVYRIVIVKNGMEDFLVFWILGWCWGC